MQIELIFVENHAKSVKTYDIAQNSITQLYIKFNLNSIY